MNTEYRILKYRTFSTYSFIIPCSMFDIIYYAERLCNTNEK